MKKVRIGIDRQVLAVAIENSPSGHHHGVNVDEVAARMGSTHRRITRFLGRQRDEQGVREWVSCRPQGHGNCTHRVDEVLANDELCAAVYEAYHSRITALSKSTTLAQTGDPRALLRSLLASDEAVSEEAM